MNEAAQRRRALALLAVLALVWGTNWPLFPLVMREMSVWTFRAVTMMVTVAVLMSVARLRGQSLALPREYWPALAAAALCNLAVWNIASAYAAILIPSGQAAILGFTMPLWAALIAWLMWREPLSARMYLALAIGAAGVGLLIWRGAEAYAQAPLGATCGLVAAIGWAAGTLVLKRTRLNGSGLPTTVLAAWQMAIAAVPIVAVAAWQFFSEGGRVNLPSATTLWVTAYIALVPMCLGNVVWFSIVGLLPAHVAGLGSVAVPMVAMLSGALVHGEPLGPVQIVAMACSMGALALALPRRGAG
ncbi:MAG: DMT family transporter [Rubrivivax sp.]|nr:DMT family transporter [Rubrivivax sp.]